MNESSLVSVVMPVYNAERYVAEAIQSVLGQTYRPLELICVNDGSKDASPARLASFGDAVRVIDFPENRGIAEARNAGVRETRGAYIAFMDADDIWEPTKLALQMAAFACDPLLEFCCAHMNCFISPELSDEVKRTRYCPPDPSPGYVAAASLVARESFMRVGFFDPQWKMGEFIDWFARAEHAGVRMRLLPEVVLHRRIHESNTGVVARDARTDYVRIARAALQRKRGAP